MATHAELVTSADNPGYKALRKLAHSSRERRKSGLTLLDGFHLIKAWLASGRHLQKIAVNAALVGNTELADWQRDHTDLEWVFYSPQRFLEIAGDDFPSGVIGLVKAPAGHSLPRNDCDTVALDGIQDPGNLGTLLRSAAAAGFRQAVLSAGCAQAWGPKTLRAGMGAHFALDLFELVDLPEFLAGFSGRVAVTDLQGDALLYQTDLRQTLAWIFGSEGEGVSAPVLQQADLRVKIPMPGAVESLNVSAAAAICLFETVRQRCST